MTKGKGPEGHQEDIQLADAFSPVIPTPETVTVSDAAVPMSLRGRLSSALAAFLGLSMVACQPDPSAEDGMESSTLPEEGEEEMEGDGDGDTQDTGMDMMEEFPPSTPNVTSPLSVEVGNQEDKTPITGKANPDEDISAVLVIDADQMQEGQALPPAMDMADLNELTGEFSYNAGLGRYVFVVEGESGLKSSPSQMVEVFWVDPCAEVMCGPHGTCTEGACDCNPGYTDTGETCEDITPPEAPVIYGGPFGIFSQDLHIEGEGPLDGEKAHYRLDKWLAPQGAEVEEGVKTQMSTYQAGSSSWYTDIIVPEVGVYYLSVWIEDAWGNTSEPAITEISRGQ